MEGRHEEKAAASGRDETCQASPTDECSRKTGHWSPDAAKRPRFRPKKRKSRLFLWESEKNNFRFWRWEKNGHSSPKTRVNHT